LPTPRENPSPAPAYCHSTTVRQRAPVADPISCCGELSAENQTGTALATPDVDVVMT